LQGHNLNDAFDMVGNRPVFKTPSANMAVAIEKPEAVTGYPGNPKHPGGFAGLSPGGHGSDQ
jgi:hypothetical protein